MGNPKNLKGLFHINHRRRLTDNERAIAGFVWIILIFVLLDKLIDGMSQLC